MTNFKAGSTSADHKPIDLSVNSKWHRRWLILLLLKLTSPFYHRDGRCIPVSRRLTVKLGEHVDLTEAATLKFIGSQTPIPVPKVYCAFTHKKTTYIAMERVEGMSIGKYVSVASEKDKEKVFQQLRGMLDQLRSLSPQSPQAVQSCTQGSICECRIPHPTPRFGPFKTIQDFHLYLRDGLQPQARERPSHLSEADWQDIKMMAAQQDAEWPSTVFTHGDLNPANILIRKGRIVAVIDWENAGWLPHYWEYTSAWTGNLTRQAWQGILPQFMDPHPEELRMETVRQKWWGEF